jgi:thioredoxin reductase
MKRAQERDPLHAHTAIPGVYAIGNVLCNHVKQVVTAAEK